jgi:glucose-1-phosphate thymidylyltransferase
MTAGSDPLVVGVVPAAGRATRLAPLPCSKELMPVGVHRDPAELRGRPKAVSHYLLDRMRTAGANRIFFVVRSGKFDIADYYGDGSNAGLPIAYLMMGDPWGPPFSAAQAAPFLDDAIVLFGFPDILIQPDDCFVRARERLRETGADIVLGLFGASLADGIDVVETSDGGRVTRLVTKEEKPARREGDTGYLLAVWGPGFTRFLVDETARLARVARSGARGAAPDWPMGAVIAAAVDAGLHVDSVFFPDASFLDIGTPLGWASASGFPGVWSGRD